MPKSRIAPISQHTHLWHLPVGLHVGSCVVSSAIGFPSSTTFSTDSSIVSSTISSVGSSIVSSTGSTSPFSVVRFPFSAFTSPFSAFTFPFSVVFTACPKSARISTISSACSPNFFKGSSVNSLTTSIVGGISRRFSTFSLSNDSALNVSFLYPSIVNSSPVAIFTLLRAAIALRANVPMPLTFTCWSSFNPTKIASTSAFKKLVASCSEVPAISATALRNSDHVIFSLAIVNPPCF